MAFTRQQYEAYKELDRRGSLSPERKQAFSVLAERGSFDEFTSGQPEQNLTEQEQLLQKFIGGTISDDELNNLESSTKQPESRREFGVAALDPSMAPETPENEYYVSRAEKMKAIRTGLETGGMMAGSSIAAPGLATAIPGGAMGYAMGAKTADIIEKYTQPTYGGQQYLPPEGQQQYTREQPETLTGQAAQSAKDIGTGLLYETGGRTLGAAIGTAAKAGQKLYTGAMSKLPALTEKETARRAAQEIEKASSQQPQFQENLQKAAEVSEEIGTSFKASLGEMTNDPGLIKLQRSIEAMPGQAAEIQLMRRADNTKAIKEYLENNFDKNRTVADLTNFLSSQEKQLAQAASTAEKTAIAGREAIPRAMPQETGERILKEIEAARAPVRAIEKEYWAKVPDYRMQTTKTDEMFKELSQRPSTARPKVKDLQKIYKEVPKTVDEMHVIEQEVNSVIFSTTATDVEKRAFGRIKTAISEDFERLGKAAEQGDFATYKGEVIHPKQLASQLADINKKIASEPAKGAATPDINKMYGELQKKGQIGIMQQVAESNENYAARLTDDYQKLLNKKAPTLAGKEKPRITMLKEQKSTIEKQLAGATEAKNAAIAYRNAKAYSKSQSIDRFKKGVVAELRKSGGEKIVSEQRPKKLMSVSSADQFIRAIGKEKAGDVMIRHYADDMMETVKFDKTGQLNPASLTNWFNKHKRVLDKYGISNAFKNVESAHTSMAAAREATAEFNKSLAAKMLNADPQNAIKALFTGGEGVSAQNTGEIMRKLIARLKGNKDAIAGLETAFKDFMVDIMETTAKTIKDDRVLSPASLSKAIRRYKPAMAVLYKGQPQKIKALQTVQRALEIQGRSAKSPLGGGSDTTEKLGAIANVFKIAATKTPGIGHIVKLTNMGLEGLAGLSKKETNDFLLRALYDPAYANIIIKAAGKNPPVNQISSTLYKMLPAATKTAADLTEGPE